MRKIKEIIIHHSWTRDQTLSDIEAIKRFHTSWRYKGNIISEKKAKQLKEQGKNVVSPWSDIGYHFIIEKDKKAFNKSDQFLAVGNYIVKFGRPVEKSGAHTLGHNYNSIGICIIGNFNKQEPNDEQLLLLKILIKYLRDKYGNLKIKYHREYAHYKSCPGLQFHNKYKEDLNG